MRMMSLLLLSALATTASAATQERVFDIVPPEGREVQTVDGYSVLRQAGTKFGAVLTFMPETETSAWIPTAVLNTSDERLKVGTHGVSARYGDTELKVWSTSGLIRLAKEGRISAPAELVASAPASGTVTGPATDAPIAPSGPDTIGPATPGGQSQTLDRGGSKARRNNAQEREHDLAVAQVSALRERLFRDETIAPRTVGRGDVRIDLPPRRNDGQPAEFVLTLTFGGESMDVRYRERVAAAP
ncbi:hypothetical protein [Arenimonas daejeonensis]|uniref:hypothetical protein n=1 Tax=Arenimonas daejeonensis TaxID=370777 RepID=UPI0011BD97C5|nr:hypothetical protein [Arenimonas daejeonensis]